MCKLRVLSVLMTDNTLRLCQCQPGRGCGPDCTVRCHVKERGFTIVNPLSFTDGAIYNGCPFLHSKMIR